MTDKEILLSGGGNDKRSVSVVSQDVSKTLNFLKDRTNVYLVGKGGTTTGWWRKWSDGWIEQGGVQNGATKDRWVITFSVSFSNTNYTLVDGHKWSINGNEKYPAREDMTLRTTTSATISTMQWWDKAMGVNWFACGY